MSWCFADGCTTNSADIAAGVACCSATNINFHHAHYAKRSPGKIPRITSITRANNTPYFLAAPVTIVGRHIAYFVLPLHIFIPVLITSGRFVLRA